MTASTSIRTEPRRGYRARWAAIGAAIAVSLGAGGFGIVNAVNTTNPQNVYVAISPCRLLDTRPGTDNVGTRATPLTAGETATFTGTGAAGNCNIPAGVSAIETNVTAIGATNGSYLTFFASDVAKPLTANLNPTPGQPPTPNSVTINLAAAGTFNLYNHAGNVDVVVDIMGYYDNHRHTTADISNEPGISYNFKQDVTAIGTNTVMNSTAIRVPSNGFLNIEATAVFDPNNNNFNQAFCQLTLNGNNIDLTQAIAWVDTTGGNKSTLSMHRTVPIAVASNPLAFNLGQSVALRCSKTAQSPSLRSMELTATFYSTGYAPFGFIILPFDAAPLDGNSEGG